MNGLSCLRLPTVVYNIELERSRPPARPRARPPVRPHIRPSVHPRVRVSEQTNLSPSSRSQLDMLTALRLKINYEIKKQHTFKEGNEKQIPVRPSILVRPCSSLKVEPSVLPSVSQADELHVKAFD